MLVVQVFDKIRVWQIHNHVTTVTKSAAIKVKRGKERINITKIHRRFGENILAFPPYRNRGNTNLDKVDGPKWSA